MLLGDRDWSQLFDEILDDVESQRPNATVSVQAYNLANIVISLAKLFGRRDAAYMPMFQMLVTYKDEVDIYIGALG